MIAKENLDKHLPALVSLAADCHVDLPLTPVKVSLRAPKTKPLPDPRLMIGTLLLATLPVPIGHTVESWSDQLKTQLVEGGYDADHVNRVLAVIIKEST